MRSLEEHTRPDLQNEQIMRVGLECAIQIGGLNQLVVRDRRRADMIGGLRAQNRRKEEHQHAQKRADALVRTHRFPPLPV
jgi:hypothetical protein